MCIEKLIGENGEKYDPMMGVVKIINEYLMGKEPTEEGLKEYLSNEYSFIQKSIKNDTNFNLSKTDLGYEVLLSKDGCKSGMFYQVTIAGRQQTYKTLYPSDMEGYGDIIYNAYKE